MFKFKFDENNLDQSFDKIASKLFEAYDLCVGRQRYRLTEMEFYYNRFGEEKFDNFAHTHGSESPEATWRLHGAGVDIVFKGKTYYGGLLIRGMESDAGVVIDGPWNLASWLVSYLGSVWKSTASFHFEKCKTPRKVLYKKVPRVGLRLRKASDLAYIGKPWRYLTWPTKTKKGRNTIALQLYQNGEHKEIDVLGLAKCTLNNYIRNFKNGKKMKVADLVNTTVNVRNTCLIFGKYVYENLEK